MNKIIAVAVIAMSVSLSSPSIASASYVTDFFNFLSPSASPSVSPPVIPNATPSMSPEESPAQIPYKENLDTPKQIAEQVRTFNTELRTLGNNSATIPLAQKRKALMSVLAKKDAKYFLSVVLPEKVRSTLPPQAQDQVEKQRIIQGQLEILHVDDFKNEKNSRFEYTLIADKRYSISSPVILELGAPEIVKASGYSLENNLVLNEGDPSITAISAAQQEGALGTQNIAAIITEMRDAKSIVNVEDVEKALFASSSPLQKFYQNQSYGKMNFSGKVYKIYIDRPMNTTGCSSGVSTSDLDVQAAIENNHIILDGVDHVLFIPPIGYCSGIGKTPHVINGRTYNISESWVGWANFTSLTLGALNPALAHELGHSLGVQHSNSEICHDGIDCEHLEYGNFFDVMGYGYGDFNALYKEQLKWLVPGDFLSINKTGDYKINSLESKSGFRAAKVINPSLGPLSVMYIERRMNSTSSWNQNVPPQKWGILLNLPQEPSHITTTAPELIDMTPDNTPSEQIFALTASDKPYTRPGSGVTFSNVNVPNEPGNETAGFRVDMNTVQCVSVSPAVTKLPAETITTVSDVSQSIMVQVKNEDPTCAAPSDFSFEFTNLPNGFTLDSADTEYSVGHNVLPKNTVYLRRGFVIEKGLDVGTYVINYIVKNTTTGKSTSGQATVVVYAKPEIISIDPSISKSGDDLMIVTNLNTGEFVSVTAFGPEYVLLYGGNIPSLASSVPGKVVIPVSIPKILDSSNSVCNGLCTSRPIPPGQYQIKLNARGSDSNSVTVTIDEERLGETVEPLQPPTIEIKAPASSSIFSRLYNLLFTVPTPTPSYSPSPSMTATPTAIASPANTASSESILSGSCSSSVKDPLVGQTVYWQASQKGGTAPYTYSWEGTDGLVSGTSLAAKTYTTTGIKTAKVTIKSTKQTTTAQCSVVVKSLATVTLSPLQTYTPSPSITATTPPSPIYTPIYTPVYIPTYSPSYTPSYLPSYSPSHSPFYSPSYSPSESPSSSPSNSASPSSSVSSNPAPVNSTQQSPSNSASPSSSDSSYNPTPHHMIANVFYSIGDLLDSLF
jgi:hypothetical protein